MINTTSSKKLLVLIFLMLSFIGFAQESGTHFTVSLANVTSTANTLEFDVMLTIDGAGDAADGQKMSAMSAGINYNTAIVNGGTLTCAYIGGKSAAIAGLVNTTTPSTVTAGHIRITASPLTIDTAFDVVNGTYTFGRYRLTNTASWTSNSDAQLWLQPNNIGRTNTAVNAFPYGATLGAASYSYSTTAPALSPGVSLLYTQAAPLTAMLNVSTQDCATLGTPVVTDVDCFGGTDGSATITMSALTPSVSAISYTIDGGASQNATLVSGAFTISGLSVGTYSVVVSNVGCPNVTVPVTVSGPTTPITNVTNESACDSYVWSVTGLTYTMSGTYTGTSTNLNGCTVNETLNLTITPSTSNTTTASACDTYTWSVNGATYTASGTYTSVVDCHTETLNLTITPSTSNTTTASACDSYIWSVNGASYTASGTYTSVVDCHTETLNLTITPSTSNTTTASACDTYTWSVNGATYTASGTYTSVVDCHTETLNLTITPSTSNTTTASACDTYTWSVNGATYTASGTYTSVVDCHTETLNLTITPSTSNTTTASACDTYTWSVNGATYTASGTYTSVVDCHTETLNLTITPSTSNTTTASACDTYTWSVNGATYTAS
ncbi:MAG: secretion protein, partial [Flavobacterium sp.]